MQYSVQDILTGCQNDNPTYQKALVHKYSDTLYAICIRYVGCRNLAKDVLQESLINAFKAIKRFDTNKGSLEGWLRKITVNCCLKQLKKNKSKQTYDMTDDHYDIMTTDNLVISKIKVDEIMQVIQELPDGYRQVFNLSVIEGYNHREIAQMLDIQEVTSRSNLSRAKAILRKIMLQKQKKEQWVKITY